ncbi:MAG: DUF6046 domain-containing protein [Rikenellaceae bacterium]
MGRLLSIGASSLVSGGVMGNGSLAGYIGTAARKTIGMGLSEFSDGGVQYFSKDYEILKRAAVQAASQLAYGALRSYPRFMLYWEQQQRDKNLAENSETSIANTSGQYYQLISEQQAVASVKNYTDTIVGNVVSDYLELSISSDGSYYNNANSTVEKNTTYGLVTFVDLQPMVQVSSKNNILLTQVQGRDYSRKEFISGGDYEITISGKITSKYPDVYPEAEVSKFLKLMQFKGVIECDNTILRQFKIERLIVLNYSFPTSSCRNIQPYSLSCVAVEPSENVELITTTQESVDKTFGETNKWIKWVNIGTDVVSPEAMLTWF